MSSNEWYTPFRYIEAAREVMGTIDLDPASCERANMTVQAARYYDETNNGLMLPWHLDGKPARIWLNPPYGRIHPERTGSTRSYQLAFGAKLLQEHANGHIEQAIVLLLGNACFTQWFQQLQLWNYPLCFHKGHITFNRPDGTTAHFGFGTIFIYIGPLEATFIKVFSQFRVRQRFVQNRAIWGPCQFRG
jgi:ParB family chromosome partitioning protein